METNERLARLETETKTQTKILVEIAKDVKSIKKEQTDHILDDEKRFSKIEADIKWTQRVGGFLITAAGGLLHWLHLK